MIPLFNQNKQKGYIVESGSNENGDYIKFNDGTMICTRTYDLADNNNFSIQYGSVYYPESGSKTWKFPKPFTKLYSLNGSSFLAGGIGGVAFTSSSTSTTEVGFYVYSVTKYDFSSKKTCAYLTAVGRWR